MAEKKLDHLPPSYANLGFDAEPIPGPSAPNIQDAGSGHDTRDHAIIPTAPVPEAPRAGIPDYNPPSLVFEDIYDACVQYLKDHCCYGSRFINRMKLTSIENKRALHYLLQSHGEKRESEIRYTPYKGGPIDGPGNGPEPDPWNMVVRSPEQFVDTRAETVIPHTTHVKTCSRCDGSGEVTCWSCGGSGRDSCGSCGGSGRDNDDHTCSSCGGSGRETCSRCGGSGEVTCGKCDGYGKIKDTKYLIVTWKTHPSDYVTDTDNLPGDLIRKAKGVILFKDKAGKLLPITNAPDALINVQSASLLELHDRAFPNELVIKQRHVLQAIPFTRVTYSWKEKVGEFYVYGTERKVYFEDYPQQCCCCTCC